MLNIIGKILMNLAIALIADPVFIRKVLFELAHRAAKLTPTDVDDKLIDLAEQALSQSRAAAAPVDGK